MGGDLFIRDIINFSDGIEYYVTLEQDVIGSHDIIFGNNFNIKLKDVDILKFPYEKTILKIISIDGILYCKIDETFSEYIPFEFTINTNLGTGSTFDLPLRSGYNYNFVVDWGDGTTNTIISFDDVDKLHTYSAHGTYQIKITGLCETWYFNNTGDKNKLISIQKFGYTGFITMEAAFRGCVNLTTVSDTDGDWCRNVINMQYMFRGCTSITNLNLNKWDLVNVINIRSMFNGCTSLTSLDIGSWNVSTVTNMSGMFTQCSSLTSLDIGSWNVSTVTNMSGMFAQCSSLTSLDIGSVGMLVLLIIWG